jgi:DNA-binding NarL/FixJ family response regulator
MHQNAAYAVQTIRAGARGYVTKSSPPEALVRAIFDVLQGKIALSADIDHELALSRLAEAPPATDVLTPREFEILRLLLAEKTAAEIATTLNLSQKTVANIHYLIKSKLGVASDIQLVLLAMRQGILTQDGGVDREPGGRRA